MPIFRIKDKLLVKYISEYFFIIVTLEWWIAAQEYVQYDAQAPYIARIVIVSS